MLVIKQIIDNFPISSPKEVVGFFDDNEFLVAGQDITLNQIENEILRSVYKDPRIHLVIVCGARGCPPITDYSYTPENLEEQLELQTTLSINDDKFINGKDISKEKIFQLTKKVLNQLEQRYYQTYI